MENEEENKFLVELRALFEKYGIAIEENDNYDGEENYIGSTFYFKGRAGIRIQVDDLEVKLREA